jgi:AcrR family transcriptional regulator
MASGPGSIAPAAMLAGASAGSTRTQVGVTTDTRARMINSAALLLREHGVAGTSIARVLEHSQGPRGSVQFHFPGGKAQLLTEALVWAGGLISKDAVTGAGPR